MSWKSSVTLKEDTRKVISSARPDEVKLTCPSFVFEMTVLSQWHAFSRRTSSQGRSYTVSWTEGEPPATHVGCRVFESTSVLHLNQKPILTGMEHRKTLTENYTWNETLLWITCENSGESAYWASRFTWHCIGRWWIRIDSGVNYIFVYQS